MKTFEGMRNGIWNQLWKVIPIDLWTWFVKSNMVCESCTIDMCFSRTKCYVVMRVSWKPPLESCTVDTNWLRTKCYIVTWVPWEPPLEPCIIDMYYFQARLILPLALTGRTWVPSHKICVHHKSSVDDWAWIWLPILENEVISPLLPGEGRRQWSLGVGEGKLAW